MRTSRQQKRFIRSQQVSLLGNHEWPRQKKATTFNCLAGFKKTLLLCLLSCRLTYSNLENGNNSKRPDFYTFWVTLSHTFIWPMCLEDKANDLFSRQRRNGTHNPPKWWFRWQTSHLNNKNVRLVLLRLKILLFREKYLFILCYIYVFCELPVLFRPTINIWKINIYGCQFFQFNANFNIFNQLLLQYFQVNIWCIFYYKENFSRIR